MSFSLSSLPHHKIVIINAIIFIIYCIVIVIFLGIGIATIIIIINIIIIISSSSSSSSLFVSSSQFYSTSNHIIGVISFDFPPPYVFMTFLILPAIASRQVFCNGIIPLTWTAFFRQIWNHLLAIKSLVSLGRWLLPFICFQHFFCDKWTYFLKPIITKSMKKLQKSSFWLHKIQSNLA